MKHIYLGLTTLAVLTAVAGCSTPDGAAVPSSTKEVQAAPTPETELEKEGADNLEKLKRMIERAERRGYR